MISDALVVPCAGVTHHDEWRLLRPYSEGRRYVPLVGDLEQTLGTELSGLLPRNRHVQTFSDFRPTRRGWEDVVFVPLGSCDDACRSARARLVPWLDARLLDTAAGSGPAPAPSVIANALSCGVGRAGGSAWWAVATGLLLLRRRRLGPAALALVALAACERAPAPAPRASASAPVALPSTSAGFARVPAVFVAPRESEARRQAVLDVLSNRFDGHVPVWSLPEQGGVPAAPSAEESAIPEETLAHARACAAGLEAVVTLEAHLDARGVVKAARALGPLPRKARECVEEQIRRTVFAPEGGERTERTQAYFGEHTEEARRVAWARLRSRPLLEPVSGPRLTVREPEVTQGLPAAVVQRVVRKRWSQLLSCQRRHAKGDDTVNATWSIDAEGAPAGVSAASARNPALAACIAGVLRMARFPRPDAAPAVVSMRFDFRAP